MRVSKSLAARFGAVVATAAIAVGGVAATADASTAHKVKTATILTGAAASPHPSRTYWTTLFYDPNHVGGIPNVSNQSLFGLLSRLLRGPDHAAPLFRPLDGALVILGIACAVLLAARSAQRRRQLGDHQRSEPAL